MNRRHFLKLGLIASWVRPLGAAVRQDDLQAASDILTRATDGGQVHAASLYVRREQQVLARAFGAARSPDDIFLIASISKPMSAAALMTLHEQGDFRLEDPVTRFIPEFKGDERERITILQLLTHASGLPDQLPENQALRAKHAELSRFVERAIVTPLLFSPGSRYSYSSMGILLASEVAHRITGLPFTRFIDQTVFGPLGMKHSALGLGRFKLEDVTRCQVEKAAPESGAGDPASKQWDWNSAYWRKLGAPWGGVHASAPDVAKFLTEFLRPEAKLLRPATARLMIRDHSRRGLTPRGLGFAVGTAAASPGCSDETFGHGGATGTLAWADPASGTVCVVLTTLPAQAADPHPRQLVSDHVANPGRKAK